MADFRSRATRLADLAADRAKGIANRAAKKTKNVSRIAKLNVDIATERDCIKRNYLEIGKLYYETHREAPESYFLELVFGRHAICHFVVFDDSGAFMRRVLHEHGYGYTCL